MISEEYDKDHQGKEAADSEYVLLRGYMEVDSGEQHHEASAVEDLSVHLPGDIVDAEVVVVPDGKVELDCRVVDDFYKKDKHRELHEYEV